MSEAEQRDERGSVLRLVFSNPTREPQLTDGELVRVRQLLASAERICAGCPMARHLMEKQG